MIAAIWYLYDDARLSGVAGNFIDQAAAAGSQIVVSSISLAELVYLIEKKRLPYNAYTDLKAALADPDHVFKEAPFMVEIVDAMRQVPRVDVPDMPDRIVAATAVYFVVPVISRDGKIRASNEQTIWQVIFLKSTGARSKPSDGKRGLFYPARIDVLAGNSGNLPKSVLQ